MRRFAQTIGMLMLTGCCALPVYAGQVARAWLPAAYVGAMNRHDSDATRFLSPIAGIIFDANGRLLISGYGSEPHAVKYKVVSAGGVKKYQLLHVEMHINLKYESRGLVDSLERSKIFLLFEGTNARLEIYYEGRVVVVDFVDRYKGETFTDIRNAMIYVGAAS